MLPRNRRGDRQRQSHRRILRRRMQRQYPRYRIARARNGYRRGDTPARRHRLRRQRHFVSRPVGEGVAKSESAIGRRKRLGIATVEIPLLFLSWVTIYNSTPNQVIASIRITDCCGSRGKAAYTDVTHPLNPPPVRGLSELIKIYGFGIPLLFFTYFYMHCDKISDRNYVFRPVSAFL